MGSAAKKQKQNAAKDVDDATHPGMEVLPKVNNTLFHFPFPHIDRSTVELDELQRLSAPMCQAHLVLKTKSKIAKVQGEQKRASMQPPPSS